MKKSILMKLLVLAVCAAMLLSLFACGPEVEDPTEEPTQQETEGNNEKPTDNSTEAPTQAGGQATDPTETDPTETDPVETEPTETDPEESKPAETDPEESKPAETDPETPSETTGTLPQESETQGNKPPVETDPACDGNHNYVAKGPQGHYCDKCGNPGRDNPILDHTYEDKDGVPTCSVCGYVADCKGVHTAYIGDETGHWTAPCDQCGAAAGTEISEHTYKYENDKYACTVCGWTLTCDGKHALVSDDVKGHHTAACEICNVPAGEIVAHVFANSVCECGYEAACKGQHKIEADAEGHSIGKCDICGAAEQVKQPHVWGAEYYTAGEAYVYGCKECGYAQYTKVVTDKVAAFITPGNAHNNKADKEKTDLSSSTKYQLKTGFAVDETTNMPYITISGTGISKEAGGQGEVSQFLWNRAIADASNRSEYEEYTFDIGNAKYLVIKARVAFKSDAKITLEYSTTGIDGKKGITIPFVKSETPEWVTYVINLETAAEGKHVKAEGAETYVVDTFYFHMEPYTAEDTWDIAYMAFVEGGWADIGEIVDEETAISVSKSGVSSVVDPTTGGCVGEHALATVLVDGEYKSACPCGYVKSSYGIKEEGPNKFGGAETLANTGSVTGKLDKTLMFDEDGTAFVRLDNFWPNRENWGDIGINLDQFAGAGATGRYLVIKVRVGEAGNGTNAISVFVNTNQSGSKNLVGEGGTSFSISKDNKWHTVVIDLAKRVKTPDVAFLPDADGSYNVRYFSIRPFGGAEKVQDDSAEGVRYFYTYWVREEDEEGKPILNDKNEETKTYKEQVLGKENRLTEEQMAEKGYNHELIYKYTLPADAYVDLSYVALFDSMDDIKNIVTADTYEWSADSSTNALRNTADNSCVEHVYVENVEGTTHKIVCGLCETPIRSFEVSADVNWYSPLDKMDKYKGSLSKMNYDPDEQVMFNRYTGNIGNHLNVTGGANAGDPTTDAFATGRYVVIKYRATNTSLGLNVATGDKKDGNGESLGTQSAANAPGNEWRVAVIDASQNKEWTSDGTAQAIYVMITTTPVEVEGVAQEYTVDIAYVAVVDSIGEMKTLLQKGETYCDYGTSFANVGVEYYQDGTKVPCKEGECVMSGATVSNNADGGKTYSFVCGKCDAPIVSKVIPSSTIYVGATDIKNAVQANITTPDGTAEADVKAEKNTLNITTQYHVTKPVYGYLDNGIPYTSFNGTKSKADATKEYKDAGKTDEEIAKLLTDNQINETTQLIWNRSYADMGKHTSKWERYNIDLGQSKYFVIRMRAMHAGFATDKEGDIATLYISTTGKDKLYPICFPMGKFQDLEAGTSDWVTFVIDLSTVAADYWVTDKTTGTYVLDTFYFNLSQFITTDRYDIEYLAFVESWNDVKDLAAGDEKVAQITSGPNATYEMVDFSGVLPGTTPEKPIDVTFTNGVASATVYAGTTMYFNVPAGITEGAELFANGVKTEYVAGETGATFTITNDTEADVVYELVAALPGYSEYNPTDIADEDYVADGEFATNVTVKVPAGATMYFAVTFADGMDVTVDGVACEVIDGVVAVTNAGEAEAEFVIRGEYVLGSEKRPDTLVDGDNIVEIPEGTMKGYYYSFTAPKSGMLTITVNSTAGWVFEISRSYWGEEEQPILNEETGETETVMVPKYFTDPVYTANSSMEDAWNPIPVQVEEGDVITVWVITFDPEASVNPAGTVTVNARFIEDHECVSDAEFVCVEGKCTICGEPMDPEAEHTEPDATTGKCTVCGEKLGLVAVTKEIAINSSSVTDKSDDKLSVTWAGEGFTVVAAGDTAYKTTDLMKGYFQIPAGYTVTVRANQISKIVITATTEAYAESIASGAVTEGATATVDGTTVVITVGEGTLDEISISITEKARINNVSVVYMA